MRNFALALTESCWDELRAALDLGVESAAVLGARVVDGPDGELTLLGRALSWVPEGAYAHRGADGLAVVSAGWVPAVARASADAATAVLVHTHPGGVALPSERDRGVDRAIAAVIRSRTRQRIYAHLIVGGSSALPSVEGIALSAGEEFPLRCVRVVGARLRVLTNTGSGEEDSSDDKAATAFDRQVRALGGGGQQTLRALHVGVVGAGGTGSPVIDQLARLGVGRLTIVDPKTLTAGNVTRVHGSGIADVEDPKVDVARRNVARIGLGARVEPIRRSVTDVEAFRALRHCDVVFGCTDDNAGRLVLSRLGYWYLMPVIDVGILIETAAAQIADVLGRVTVTGPGAACLLCRSRIDLARAHAEALEPEERARLAKEGYVVGLGEPDPAVVAFTTYVASVAVSELLQRLVGYGPAHAPTEQLLQIDRRRISTNTAISRRGCYCADPDLLGAGDTQPPLELTWT